jgi:hypothetical protein
MPLDPERSGPQVFHNRNPWVPRWTLDIGQTCRARRPSRLLSDIIHSDLMIAIAAERSSEEEDRRRSLVARS